MTLNIERTVGGLAPALPLRANSVSEASVPFATRPETILTVARPSIVEQWLRRNTGIALLLVGILLVGAGAFVVESTAVATAVATIGAAAMVLAILLPRSEGRMKLGPSGLEVVLAKVEQKSEERGLEPELRAEAVVAVLESLHDQAQVHGDLQPENILVSHGAVMNLNFDELIDQAVEDVVAMVDVSPEDVPPAALRAIQTAVDLPDVSHVRRAQRRSGRGAPRWEIWTDVGKWRVSNTRHGWNARRLDD